MDYILQKTNLKHILLFHSYKNTHFVCFTVVGQTALIHRIQIWCPTLPTSKQYPSCYQHLL